MHNRSCLNTLGICDTEKTLYAFLILIAAKFLDVATTFYHLKTSGIESELNPIVRRIVVWLGPEYGLTFVFLLPILLCAFCYRFFPARRERVISIIFIAAIITAIVGISNFIQIFL